MIDRIQGETENYIPRKVIGSFISVEKHEAENRKTRYTNEQIYKEARLFLFYQIWRFFMSMLERKIFLTRFYKRRLI